MNILYCGDANIADGVLMSVLSLMKHTEEPLNIYLLTASLCREGKECHPLSEEFSAFLAGIVRRENPKSSVSLTDLSELFERELPLANIETRFTPCCMLRLFADQVEGLPDRLLYLDNDVLCRGDFSPFYHESMENVEVAGVLDYYGSWFFRNPVWRWWRRDYLNSGVLLLNLAEIRKTQLFAKCRALCVEKKLFMPDQSAINKLAKGKRICPRKYNEQRKTHKNTVFRHFTTSFRFFPWIRTVRVKPWDVERLHSVLRIDEFDGLIEEWNQRKQEYVTTKKENRYETTA